MMYIYLLLSVIADAAITVGCGLVVSPADIWKPLLIFPALFIGFILFHLLVFILLSLTINRKKEVKNVDNFYTRFMLISLALYFELARVRIHVSGEDKLPQDGRYLFVSNHISIYDPMITMLKFAKEKLRFVSKKENLSIPFAGAYIARSGCIGIDRENNRSAVRSINEAVRTITDGICPVGIYPEGRVNTAGVGLLEFRNGAFKIATKSKVPVAVAVIRNTREINKNILRRSTDIYLDVVDIIPYSAIEGMKTVEIGSVVRTIMEEALKNNMTEVKK